MSRHDRPSRAGYGAPSPEGTAGLLGAARRTARERDDHRAGARVTRVRPLRAFDDDAGREAHLGGQAAKTFFGAEHRLMTAAPVTTKIEILGSKMPKVLEGVTKGLVLRFKAKPGKEAEVAQMMRDCQPLVEKETGTLAWFANQYDESHFGTFAVFADNGGRFSHLTGQIPRELGMTGLSLLGGAPEVHMVDVMTGTSRQRD